MILLVPDAYGGAQSGGIAAAEAARQLEEMGATVWVFADPAVAPGCGTGSAERFIPRKPGKVIDQVFGGDARAELSAALAKSNATAVFFLGGGINKPASLMLEAAARGLRTVAMLWVQDYFCATNYGVREAKSCDLCVEGNYWASLTHMCPVPTTFHPIKAPIAMLARTFLRHGLLNGIDVVMGSSLEQLTLLERYGVNPRRMVRCPLFFPKERLQGLNSALGDYFVFPAQATRVEKGWSVVIDLLRRLPKLKVVVPLAGNCDPRAYARQVNVESSFDAGQVRFVPGVTFQTGGGELVANARGVMIPSLWRTTTEYTLLEALGLGKAVVCFDSGIHGEELVHGVNALVAPTGDRKTFAVHVETLIEDPSVAKALEKGAQVAYGKLTSSDRIQEALIAAFCP